MISWLRYVRHIDVPDYEAAGWRYASDLGPTHGQYSVLLEYPERWLPIAGYEGVYEVSCLGVVRSLPRTINKPFAKSGYPKRVQGRVLKTRSVHGYLTVSLSSADGEKKNFYVAHLVAAAFIGPRPSGLFVCHNDGDRGHNAAFNLRYDTRIGNEADKIGHGTRHSGEKCPASKLSAEAVSIIRESRGLVTQQALADRFGVTQPNISLIQSGASWAGEGSPSPRQSPTAERDAR